MHSNIVERVDTTSSRNRGTVIESRVELTLRNKNTIIKIDSTQVRHCLPYKEDELVVYDELYLCSIEEIETEFLFLIDEDNEVIIPKKKLDKFRTKNKKSKLSALETEYILGKAVVIPGRNDFLKDITYRKGAYSNLHKKGIISETAITKVKLKAKSNSEYLTLIKRKYRNITDEILSKITRLHTKKETILVTRKNFGKIKQFNRFKHCEFNTYDTVVFKDKQTENETLKLDSYAKSETSDYADEIDVSQLIYWRIISTRTKCTVYWSDGSVQHNLKATDLVPVEYTENMELFVNDIIFNNDKIGIVTKVDNNQKQCVVKYYKDIETEKYVPFTKKVIGFENEELVSMFKVSSNVEFEYRIGDIVLDFSNMTFGEIDSFDPNNNVTVYSVNSVKYKPNLLDLLPLNDIDNDCYTEDSSSQSIPSKESDENNNSDLCNFEILDYVHSDHYYIKSATHEIRTPFIKRIRKEHEILRNNLTQTTIYVMAYEQRLDLMRALVIGSKDTIYEDTPFIFDIYVNPNTFPQEPMEIHYFAIFNKTQSKEAQINHNLYNSGKVCLSLLNTWKGSKEEVWDSKTSSIYQVLISIQALVLNNEPFYNEHNYDKLNREISRSKSLEYNEHVLIFSLKSIAEVVKNKNIKHLNRIIKHYYTKTKINQIFNRIQNIVKITSHNGLKLPDKLSKGCAEYIAEIAYEIKHS